MSRNSSDLLPFTCNTSFDSKFEIAKYIGTLIYLVPGVLLHFLILRCILFKERRVFKESSFFQIYATDSIASAWILFWNIFVDRLFLYVPPLCPIVGPFFWSPSILLKVYYYTTAHARFAKAVTQVIMVLNRMSCVLLTNNYTQVWRQLTPISIFLVVIVPLGGTWNVLISRVYLLPAFGGFGVNYRKTVEWASLSMFQSIYILTALVFTVICTSVTLYKLIFLPERIRSAEKSLCFTSIFISITFLLVAGTQLLFVFCESCKPQELFIAQFLAFDILNVGSAMIMLVTNTQLRELIFPVRRGIGDRIFQISTNNSSS